MAAEDFAATPSSFSCSPNLSQALFAVSSSTPLSFAAAVLVQTKMGWKGSSTVKVLETDRLILSRLSIRDADFILELLNEPSWVRFIGNRGVRTIADARNYILKGPVESYKRFGFGMYATKLKAGGTRIGICGLVKRESLEDVDIGFAFLPKFWGQGYAYESASAVMAHGKSAFGLKRIVAITTPDNHSSIKVLEKLGLRFERVVNWNEDGSELKLYAHDF